MQIQFPAAVTIIIVITTGWILPKYWQLVLVQLELLFQQVPAWLDVLGLEEDHVHGDHVLSDGDGEVVHGLHEDRSGVGEEDQVHSEGHQGVQA